MFGISRYCSSLVSFSFPSHRPSQSRCSLRTSDRDFRFESLGSRQNFQYGLIKHSSKKYTIPSTTETGFDGQKHVCIFADAILAHEAGTVRTRAGSNLKLLQRTNILVIVVSLRSAVWLPTLPPARSQKLDRAKTSLGYHLLA